MSVNLPKDPTSVNLNTPIPTNSKTNNASPKNTISRTQIPPAETQHQPLANIEDKLQEIKDHETPLNPEALRNAVNTNDLAYLKKYLTPAKLSAYNRQEGRPLLNTAIFSQNREVIAFILSLKTELDACDKAGGDSPIHIAVAIRNEEILELLLKAKCSPNLKDRSGNTPLHDASMGKISIIKILLAHGANPKVVNHIGETPSRVALKANPQNAKVLREANQEFEEAVERTKMLGLRFGLNEDIQVDGQKMKLGGAWRSEYTWPELEKSIQSWMESPAFFSPLNEYGKPLLDDTDMQEILAAVRQGYSGNPIDPKAQLIMLRAGTVEHHTSVVASPTHICECNRGGGSGLRPGIIMYEFLEQDLISRKELLKVFQYSVGSPLYRAEFRKPPYVREVHYIPHKDQSGPTCSWAQAKLAFRAALQLKLEEKKVKGMSHEIAKQMSFGMYKSFTTFDREKGVSEYLCDPYLAKADSHFDKNKILRFVFRKTINTRFFPIMNTLLSNAQMDVTKESKTLETPLHIAVKTRNYPQIHALLAQGLDVNKGDIKGVTPFHLACAMGDPYILQAMLSTADLNKPNGEGYTPLHIAAQFGNPFLVQHLLSNNANPLAVANSGQNALHLAAKNPHPQVINMLVQAGVNVAAYDREGVSPLHIACANGNAALAKFLLEHEANPNIKDARGDTPFTLACQWESPELIDEMVQRGANLKQGIEAATKVKNVAILTRLKQAQLEEKAAEVSDETLQDLKKAVQSSDLVRLEKYLSPERIVAYNRRNPTSLFADCIEMRSPQMLKLVLDKKVDLDFVDEKGLSIAHLGVLHPDIDYLRIIVDAKCPMDIQDLEGNTPLHIAAKKDYSFVDELLFAGADPRIPNYSGQTPAQLAELNKKTYTVNKLNEEIEKLEQKATTEEPSQEEFS